MEKLKAYLSLVKFSHSIFAMPFAIVGFVLCLQTYPQALKLQTFLLIILCMIFARNAAMAFNRLVDREIDKKNPRTQTREIPAGVIAPQQATLFIVANCIGFVVVSYLINTLCFLLSPVALFVILFYSYSKRFTALCHYILGLGLGLAPLGAYLAGGGQFDLAPILIALSVLCWVAGFDIVYALQDEELDKSLDLKSVPSQFGKTRALVISRITHFFSALFLLLSTIYLQNTNPEIFGSLLWVGSFFFIGFLIYQQTLVSANDLSKINLSFFTMNGLASIIFSLFFILDVYFNAVL